MLHTEKYKRCAYCGFEYYPGHALQPLTYDSHTHLRPTSLGFNSAISKSYWILELSAQEKVGHFFWLATYFLNKQAWYKMAYTQFIGQNTGFQR